jgi:hypothetical protein
MLQDMFFISLYFDPMSAVMAEDEMRRRYGAAALEAAMVKGWLGSKFLLCRETPAARVFWLTDKGRAAAAQG